MDRNRQPCNSVFMVNIASGMDLGRVRPTMTMTTTNDDDVVQRGGHTPANTESCSLGLQRTSLILDIHVMVKNGYPLTSITWSYRGLKFKTHRDHVFFFKLTTDHLLVFRSDRGLKPG